MELARTRYEVRVRTLVSQEALATFRVPLRPTAVPRKTTYRLCVPADRDLSEVLNRLTELDVQVLEIRRCPEPRSPDRGAAPVRQEAARQAVSDPDGVVVAFRAAGGPRPTGTDPAPGARPTPRRPGPDPTGGPSAG
ncbi:MAG: hypothetical protein JWP40_4081 [Blastococcus sp.]|nr:hypothetical protein [Blastococcus sp.]